MQVLPQKVSHISNSRIIFKKLATPMKFELNNEIDVPLPASSIWRVYSSKDLPKLVVKLLPDYFHRIDYISGDGGVDTMIRCVPPGENPQSYKEMCTTIDHDKLLKEVHQVEGPYLDMGMTYYMDKFEIIKAGPNSCVIRSTTEYEVPDDRVDKYLKEEEKISVDGLVPMALAIVKFVQKNGDQVNIADWLSQQP